MHLAQTRFVNAHPHWRDQWPCPPCRKTPPHGPAGGTAAPARRQAPGVFGVSNSKARALQGIAASSACAWPNCTCTVGLPRRSIVVHAGHVIVHQRISMDQLHGARCAQRSFVKPVRGAGSGGLEQAVHRRRLRRWLRAPPSPARAQALAPHRARHSASPARDRRGIPHPALQRLLHLGEGALLQTCKAC